MLHVGLDLSRRRLDYRILTTEGEDLQVGASPPDGEGLDALAEQIAARYPGEPIRAAIESMNGARFVHDRLEQCGWEVEIADALKVKGLAPLAAKTDKIDAWVLAELSRIDLVPAIWLPDPEIRAERERSRYRLHLGSHRSRLKNRIHATLLAHGIPCRVSDLFGKEGRRLLGEMDLPEPWRTNVTASVQMIDSLQAQITEIERQLRRMGASHPYVSLLETAPGIGWVLGYTIASEIGEIGRFTSPAKLVGYSGLAPRVYQSGDSDRRGALTKQGPKYLRWALMEAATHACRHRVYRDRYQRNRQRLGRQRGPKVAQVDIARKLAEAIWHMLKRNEAFAPAGAEHPLAA
jgi:transposase